MTRREGIKLTGRITKWDHSRNKGQNCSINDTHGHHAGDLVLHHLARLLYESVSVSDFVALFTVDKFVVLACDRAQASNLITILEDTLSANLLRLEDGNEISITVISKLVIIRKLPFSSIRERMKAYIG